MTTNEIFVTMVAWIVDNTEMRNPTQALRKAGLDAANYSKIKSGTNKSVKYEIMLKLNKAFGKPFNPEWMRGKSDVMLVDDIAQICSDKRSEPVDMTASLIASLRDQLADKERIIASKEETIAAQKRELEAKDKTIAANEVLIKNLQQTVARLTADLAMEKGLSTGTSLLAPAESEHSRQTV